MRLLALSSAFLAGLVTLGLEVLGFRLFAPFFGFSIFVSGALIGVVLAALALGYWLGGRLADARPVSVPALFLASAGFLLLVFAGYADLLAFLARWDPGLGSAVAAALLFAAPMLLLSMVPPVLVKRLATTGTVGAAAGQVSAWGTAGAIAGTFLVTFLLVPEAGSRLTLLLLLALCGLAGVAGLPFLRGRKILLIALFALLPAPALAHEQLLFETESAYNAIRVTDDDGVRALILNQPAWWQSVTADRIEKNRYYYAMNLGPLAAGGRPAQNRQAQSLPAASRILLLGLGGGVNALQFRELFDAEVTAVELDPAVVSVAHEYFGLPRDDPKLRVVVADARPFLARSAETYDTIAVDVYQGGPYIPFYLATREFFADARRRLHPSGTLVMNALAPPGRSRLALADAIGRTMQEAFPSVFLLDRGTNVILLATAEPATRDAVLARIAGNEEPELAELRELAALGLQEFIPSPAAIVLTDDRAPLEQLTARALNG